jgi:hypothetical protein
MTTRGTFYLDAYDKASVNAFGYVKCDTGFINGADLQGNPIILSQGESQASQELSNTLDKLDQETQAQDIVQAGR